MLYLSSDKMYGHLCSKVVLQKQNLCPSGLPITIPREGIEYQAATVHWKVAIPGIKNLGSNPSSVL